MRSSIRGRRMWAVGRTVNASSVSDIVESLEKPDAEDDIKEEYYLKFVGMTKDIPGEMRMRAERFLGCFPDKSADPEKMKLYLNDFDRLCKRLQAGM
jgi:hypothetical protein